jgi:hypothetical protein
MDKNAFNSGDRLSVVTYDDCTMKYDDGTPVKFLRNSEWIDIETGHIKLKDFRIMLMFPACPRRRDMIMCFNSEIRQAIDKKSHATRQFKPAIRLTPFNVDLFLDDPGTTIFDDWHIHKDRGINDDDKYVIEIKPPECYTRIS